MKGRRADIPAEPRTTGDALEAPSAPGAWLRRNTWLLDLLVATGMFLYTLPFLPFYATGAGHGVLLLLVSAALCGPYLLRRRHPLVILGVQLSAACMHLLLGAPFLAADVMLLFGVYNVATRFLWFVSLPSAMAVIAWLLVAALPRLGPEFLDVGQLGLLIVVTIWVWTWGTLVRIRRDYIVSLRERAEQAEREREAETRMAVADERARVAREIHDIVSHGLSVVVVMADGAASKVDVEPERARSAMLTVRDTGRTALAEMRRMLGVLRDDEPGSKAPQPGIGDLGRLVEESRAAGLPVALVVEGDPAEVADSVGLAVFRVAQEALTNARRHGRDVGSAEVLLRYRGDEIEVRIVDDGASGAPTSGGHGLVGMRERVAAYGGSLTAGSPENGGFEVRAVLPTGGDG